MRKFLALMLLLALATVAYADMYQDASNAKQPEAMTKLLSDGALIGGTVNFSTGLKPRIHADNIGSGATGC
jgi:hypothetical protein